MGFLDMFKREEKENKVNFKGNKDGFWREENSEGIYKNGVKTGLWKENSYSEDGGIIHSKGHYKDGEKIGIWITTSNEETKKMNYIIKKDKRIDQELYDNEKVKRERIFTQGVEIGQKEYYKNGQLKEEYELEIDGKTDYKRYNENGVMEEKGKFNEEMKKVGDWVTLDKTNTPTNVKTYDEDILIKEVNYKNGILNGPMREYDKETGGLISEKIFKGGAEEKLMETLRAAQPIQEKSQGIER